MSAVSPSHAASQSRKNSESGVEEALRYLKGYIRIDTTNPPGNELPAAQYLRDILVREGVPCQVFVSTPGRGNLLARLESDSDKPEPPLLLLHHLDVVPVSRDEWKVDPFSAIEKDRYLWGRGALDTKSTGILHLITLLRLKREKVPLNRDLLLLAVADEEVGGRWGSQWMVDTHWDKMEPGFVIDEGGFGLEGVLTSDNRTIYGYAVQEKQVFWLRVRAHGRSSHGSIPQPENPNEILRKALLRIEQTIVRYGGKPPEVVRELDRRLPKIRRTPLTQAMRTNTMAVTSWLSWSGDLEHPKVNVIPAEAVATIDCRLLPGEDQDALFEKIQKAVGDPRVVVQVIVRTRKIDGPVGFDTPLSRSLERAVKRNDPKAMVIPILMPAATDSRFFREKGAVSHGLNPLVLTEEEYALLHAANERMPLDRLERALGIMYDWVKDFCTSNPRNSKESNGSHR